VSLIRKLFIIAVAAAAAAPVLADAAAAQGRRDVRRAAAPRAGGVVIAAYYRPLRLPLFYDPFYDPWWFPYRYGAFGYGYPYGRPYAAEASMRTRVTPRDAAVFIDGYYAGVVDDFDGVFQRLHLEPGEHDVTLYLQGFRSATHRVYLQPGRTFTIEDSLQPLAPGDTADPRPAPPARATPTTGSRQGADAIRGDARFGAIAIRVQPGDADVLIDDERWAGPSDDEALIVQVAPGRHRIEVRKAGYRTYDGEVDVVAAETSPINISLPRE
jgi:hypothetical protein